MVVYHAVRSIGKTGKLQRGGGMSILGGAEGEEVGVGQPAQRWNY